MQSDWKTFLAPGTAVPSPTEPLKLSKEEWRKRLPPQAYGVLREENTERAGTSPLNNEKRPRRVRLRRLRPAPVHLGDEVRVGHRLAELLHRHPERVRDKKDFYTQSTRAPSTTARAAADTTDTCSTSGPPPTTRRWLQQRRRAALYLRAVNPAAG